VENIKGFEASLHFNRKFTQTKPSMGAAEIGECQKVLGYAKKGDEHLKGHESSC